MHEALNYEEEEGKVVHLRARRSVRPYSRTCETGALSSFKKQAHLRQLTRTDAVSVPIHGHLRQVRLKKHLRQVARILAG
jgi:hypothetical protein